MRRLLAAVVFVGVTTYGVWTSAAEPGYEIGGPLAGLKLPPNGPRKEVLLYPGSVEHYQAYWTKYCPVRSFFDQQSLLRNWVAPDIPGAAAAQVEDYASPVYQTPKNGRSTKTDKTLPPVKVVRWKLDSPAFTLNLGELTEGVYAVRVIAAVEAR